MDFSAIPGANRETIQQALSALAKLPPEKMAEMAARLPVKIEPKDLEMLVRGAARLERLDAARQDYGAFFEQIAELKLARHHRLLTEKLMDVVNGKCRRLLVCWPPGHSKSTLISHHFPPFYLGVKHKHKVVLGTHTETFAERWGRRARNIVGSDQYRAIFEFGLAPDQQAAARWETEKGGEFFGIGVGGTITGHRASVLILDDIFSGREVADSETMREKIWDWYRGDVYTRLYPGAAIICIATRWHEDDLMGRLIAAEKAGSGDKWDKLILPALAEENDPMGRAIGEPLWPEWQDRRSLLQTKRVIGERDWASLYQQRPSPQEGGLIKRAWWRRWKGEHLPPLKFVLQSWDTAFTKTDQAAWSACTTWGVFDNNGVDNLILLASWRGKVEYPELRPLIQRMAADYRDTGKNTKVNNGYGRMVEVPLVRPDGKHKADMILVEAKASGLTLIPDLTRAGIHVTPFDPRRYGDKTNRVRLVTHLIEGGLVWLPTLAPAFTQFTPQAQEVVDQAAIFPNADARDTVDTLTQALIRMQKSGWVVHPGDPAPGPPSLEELLRRGEAAGRRGGVALY